jgi:hypothetical protein
MQRDEDMTPSNTTIDYKVCSFLYLHSDFEYNLLGSTCTYRYLNVGTNMSQSVSPLKLNFRFISSLAVLHCEGHNSSIRSAIEVNEHFMERLFDKLSNRSSSTSISHWQGLQIIETFYRYFCQVLRRRRGLLIHTWDPGPSWSTLPRRWRTPKRCPRTSSSLATTLGVKEGRPSQVGGLI